MSLTQKLEVPAGLLSHLPEHLARQVQATSHTAGLGEARADALDSLSFLPGRRMRASSPEPGTRGTRRSSVVLSAAPDADPSERAAQKASAFKKAVGKVATVSTASRSFRRSTVEEQMESYNKMRDSTWEMLGLEPPKRQAEQQREIRSHTSAGHRPPDALPRGYIGSPGRRPSTLPRAAAEQAQPPAADEPSAQLRPAAMPVRRVTTLSELAFKKMDPLQVEHTWKVLGAAQGFSPFWHGFSEDEIRSLVLASNVAVQRFRRGDAIICAGDDADHVALIIAGSAAANVRDPNRPEKTITIGTINMGEFVGEMALWEGGRRSADVVAATEETVTARFLFTDIVDLYEANPKLGQRLLKIFTTSTISKLKLQNLKQLASVKMTDDPNAPNAPEPARMPAGRMMSLLKAAHGPKQNLGRELGEIDLQALARRVQLIQTTAPNSNLIKGNMLCERLLIVLEGSVNRVNGGEVQSYTVGQFVNLESFLDSFVQQTTNGADVVAPKPNTLVGSLSLTDLRAMNKTHPMLAFKLVCHAGEVAVLRMQRRISQLKCGNQDDVVANPPKFLQNVMAKWQFSKTSYLLPADLTNEDFEKVRDSQVNGEAETEVLFKSIETFGDGMDKVDISRMQMLRRTNCFSDAFTGFSLEDLDLMAKQATFIRVPDEEPVLRYGQTPSFVGVIVNGSAAVEVNGERVAELKAGEILGEMSLFQGGVRLATVVSTSDDTVIAALPFENMLLNNMSHPILGLKVLFMCVQAALNKLKNTMAKTLPIEQMDSVVASPTFIKELVQRANTDVIRSSSKATMHTKGIAEDLQDGEIDIIATKSSLCVFEPAEQVMRQGTLGTYVLFLVKGSMDVRIGGRGGVTVDTKTIGEFVGESAYLEVKDQRALPRSADIFAGPEGASALRISYDDLLILNLEAPLLGMRLLTRMAEVTVAKYRNAASKSFKLKMEGEGKKEGGGGGKKLSKLLSQAASKTNALEKFKRNQKKGKAGSSKPVRPSDAYTG